MHIHRMKVKNFRLLANVELVFEEETTVIVGRNNSGKTSLSEVIRRFLIDTSPSFQIEDFSISSYDQFCDALQAKNNRRENDEIRALLPSIELRIYFQYDPAQPELGPLSNFVIDLDLECNEALAVACFELQDGIITDIDSVQAPGGAACTVHQGSVSSNACLNNWFAGNDTSLAALLAKSDTEKVNDNKRIAFQRPEVKNGPCGRTFEDAFMLANPTLFEIQGVTPGDQEICASNKMDKIKKSEFALKHAIDFTDWAVPGYILDGLWWLATGYPPAANTADELVGAGASHE